MSDYILFNAAIISDNRIDGLVRYSTEILKRINKEKFIFIANKKIIEKYKIENYIEINENLSKNSTLSNLKRFIFYQSYLRRYIQKYKIKAFYSPVPEGIMYSNTRQIITIHDTIPLKYPKSHKRIRYIYKYLIPLVLKNNTTIITVSESSKEDIQEFYKLNPEKIHIANPGLDKKLFRPAEKTLIKKILKKYCIKEKYLLYVGAIRVYKNVERLIKAFHKIKEKNVDLVIVGKFTRDTEYIREIPEKLSIDNNVKFIDFVPDEELVPLHSGASVFVFPSLYEGFGIPPLEAMACGTPVVASKIKSLSHVCGEAAVYVNPESIESIAEGIKKVLYNKKLQEILIQKGFKQIDKFSWDDIVRKIEKIIGL